MKLSNSKPGCRASALHFFVKWMPSMAFWHRAHSDTCFLQLLTPGLTPVSLLESKSGYWNCQATRGHLKTTIFTSVVCVPGQGFRKHCSRRKAMGRRRGNFTHRQRRKWALRWDIMIEKQDRTCVFGAKGRAGHKRAATWWWSLTSPPSYPMSQRKKKEENIYK